LTTLSTFFGGIASAVASGVQWVIPSAGDTFEVETGTLTGEWTEPGAGGPVNSQGAAGFVNGVGARIRWVTTGFTSRGRLIGTTFVVPLGNNSYEGAGNLTADTITDLQAAANALVAGATGSLAIWHRPSPSAPAGGTAFPVASAAVPDAVSWLRSRRT